MPLIPLEFPEGAEVLFSSLAYPSEMDEFDRDVAAVKLPHGYGIDVEWDDDSCEFVVVVYRNSFDHVLEERRLRDSRKVVEFMKERAFDYTLGKSTFTEHDTTPEKQVDADNDFYVLRPRQREKVA